MMDKNTSTTQRVADVSPILIASFSSQSLKLHRYESRSSSSEGRCFDGCGNCIMNKMMPNGHDCEDGWAHNRFS